MKRVPSTITPIIAVSRKSSAPLHRQIYDSFRDLIVQGNLVSGQQIPSTRTLAKELGISRFPVLNAYAQLLAEGYFEGRTGSGTLYLAPPVGDRLQFFRGLASRRKYLRNFLGSKANRGYTAALHLLAVNSPWIISHLICGRGCLRSDAEE
jgi:DNA-binding transcriptional regulator YhcF (GntR family)